MSMRGVAHVLYEGVYGLWPVSSVSVWLLGGLTCYCYCYQSSRPLALHVKRGVQSHKSYRIALALTISFSASNSIAFTSGLGGGGASRK